MSDIMKLLLTTMLGGFIGGGLALVGGWIRNHDKLTTLVAEMKDLKEQLAKERNASV